MAITKLNSLAIPPNTIVESDLSYPLTNFSSTGIDDNATSTAVTIDSSQNVGVGTTSPDGTFHVKDAIAQVYIQSNDGQPSQVVFGDVSDASGGMVEYTSSNEMTFKTNNLNERMRIDSSGNVGIGTASPQRTFHVSSGATNVVTRFESTDSVAVAEFKDNAGTVEIGCSGNDVILAPAGVERMRIDSSGDISFAGSLNQNHDGGQSFNMTRYDSTIGINNTLGEIVFRGTEDSGTTIRNSAKIACQTSENHTSSASGGHLLFYTTPTGSTSITERMRIDSYGALQLGGTTNAGFIDFDGDALQINTQRNPNTGAFVNTGKAHANITLAGNSGGSHIRFGTASANNTAITERMRILSSGNIVMGLSADYYSAKLAVGQSGGNPALACRTSNSTGTVALVIFSDGNSQDCGSIDVNATANTTNYSTSSDQRLKENIVDAPSGNIDDVRVRSFDWKSSGHHQTYGLIAQELVDVAPEAVSQGKKEEDTWKVDYSKLVPMMIKEIQDLKAEVAALKGA